MGPDTVSPWPCNLGLTFLQPSWHGNELLHGLYALKGPCLHGHVDFTASLSSCGLPLWSQRSHMGLATAWLWRPLHLQHLDSHCTPMPLVAVSLFPTWSESFPASILFLIFAFINISAKKNLFHKSRRAEKEFWYYNDVTCSWKSWAYRTKKTHIGLSSKIILDK